ncbi:MAG: 4Fe-4S dicluster domain-containing protein, partial [Gordonibacter sp.]
RYCEGMPAPEATKPAFLVWNPREKTKLLPYDVQEAVALNQQRGDLDTLFESEEDLVNFEEGTIHRNALRMKHASTAEFMRATRNDMA